MANCNLIGALVMQWADQDWLSLLASAPACLEVLAQCCLLASGLGRGTTVTFSDASKFNKGYVELLHYPKRAANPVLYILTIGPIHIDAICSVLFWWI